MSNNVTSVEAIAESIAKSKAEAKAEAKAKAIAKAEAKAKAIAKAKSDEAKQDLVNNSIDFVRKDLRDGIYTGNGPNGKIEIRGRSHYHSNIQVEVDFLNADPEIVVFNSGKNKNKNKK